MFDLSLVPFNGITPLSTNVHVPKMVTVTHDPLRTTYGRCVKIFTTVQECRGGMKGHLLLPPQKQYDSI